MEFFNVIIDFITITLPAFFDAVIGFFQGIVNWIANIPYLGEVFTAIITWLDSLVQFILSATGGCV